MYSLTIDPLVAFGKKHNAQTDNADTPRKKAHTKRNIAIGAAVIGTAAAITAGVVYRKNIADVFKTGFGKIKNMFSKQAKPATIFDNTPGYSKETKDLIKNEIINMFSNETIAAKEAARAKELKAMRLDAINAFQKMDINA